MIYVHSADGTLSTGELLYALGNVASKQEQLYESFDYHSRAMSRFQSIVGTEHASTAKTGAKLACHYLRVGDYNSARYVYHVCDLPGHSPLRLFGR